MNAEKLFSVTNQKGKGWTKCVDVYLSDAGKRTPKIFWRGHDEETAKRKVVPAYRELWRGIGPEGRSESSGR